MCSQTLADMPFFVRLCCSDDSLEEEVQRELKDLMDEVFLLGSLTHPCISRFCALCLDPPMIVMQYYSHGSMYELLKRGKKGDRRSLQELTWSKRSVCFVAMRLLHRLDLLP